MWDKRNPALLQAAAKQVTPETAFVIQTGDLVNGDCFHPDGASRMLRDALREMKAAFPALPFLPVVGNHDIHGMEMAEAYAETMPPFLSSQCRQPVSGSDFYFLQGPDLFLFVNFNNPDCAVIQEAFAKHADARYRFVISHGPVIPSESYSTWMLLGTNGRMRAEMRELFLQNDVIVFSGHTHTLELEECVTDSGRMTQLIASSVWDDASLAIPEILTENPEDYGKKQQSYDGFQLLREYSSALTRYLLAHGAGFLAIDIGPSGIVAHFFGGASETPSAEIRLR